MPQKLPVKRNKPQYISHHCKTCRMLLVSDNSWHDEWNCPICKDYIYLDWCDEDFKNIEKTLSNDDISFNRRI